MPDQGPVQIEHLSALSFYDDKFMYKKKSYAFDDVAHITFAAAKTQHRVNFVKATTDKSSPDFVPLEARIATFDQDGTLWVEHPMYGQVVYSLDRVPAVVKAKPELANVEPFKTVLSGDREAMAKLTTHDLEKILAATLTGMTVDTFNAEAKKWSDGAKDGRWKRPYTELTYQPMQELLSHLRTNGFKTYIVTGGGQDFVRVYSEKVYGIPPEQVVGTAGSTKYSYDESGKPILTKEPKLLLNDNDAGKPEGIHLMIGRRPVAAFGNSTGDRQMLEYTDAGDGLRLKMLVLHDDAEREYAYGPAEGLPDTKVGSGVPPEEWLRLEDRSSEGPCRNEFGCWCTARLPGLPLDQARRLRVRGSHNE